MKLVNTKDIKRALDDNDLDFDDFFDSKAATAGPCRHIRIRPENDEVVLFLDNKELMRQSLKKLGNSKGLSKEVLDESMFLWREGHMDDLRSLLKIKTPKGKSS